MIIQGVRRRVREDQDGPQEGRPAQEQARQAQYYYYYYHHVIYIYI